MEVVGGDKYEYFVGGIVYKNNSLDFIPTAEGRYNNIGYEYNLNDHLGNLRVSFSCLGGILRTLQTSHQDPWGLNLPISSSTGAMYGVKASRYLFLNREEQTETGYVDLVHRQYDPTAPHFLSVEPKTDNQEHLSVYQYSYNNPVRFSDPDGLQGNEGCCGNGMSLVENVYWSTRDAIVSSAVTVGTFVGSLFSDNVQPQRVTASYGAGGRTLTKENIPKGELAGELLGRSLTLPSAVPSAGSAGSGLLMARTGTRTATTTSLVKTLKEEASEVKNVLNNGKNSVTIKTTNGQTRYDLEGKAHAGVETPHLQKYKYNTVDGVVKSVSRESKTAEPMTKSDVRLVKKYLKNQD